MSSKSASKGTAKRKSVSGVASPRLDRFFTKPETTSIEAVINIDDEDDAGSNEKPHVEFIEVERPKKRVKTAEVIIDDDDQIDPMDLNPFPTTDANNSIFNVLKPKKGSRWNVVSPVGINYSYQLTNKPKECSLSDLCDLNYFVISLRPWAAEVYVRVAYEVFSSAESFESPKRVSRRITRRFDGDLVADDIVLTFDAVTKRFRALFRPHPLILSDVVATENVSDAPTISADQSEASTQVASKPSTAFETASSLVLDTPLWQKYLNYHTPVTFGIQNPALVNQPSVQQNWGRFFPPRPKSAQNSPSVSKRAPSSSNQTESELEGQNGVWLRSFYGSSPSFKVFAFDETNGASSSPTSVIDSEAIQPVMGMSPSLLKSLLQKSVRRCRTTHSVRLAKALICFNFLEFVRRFAIIIIEDGILHPDLPIFTWLLVQTQSDPSWHPSKLLLDHLLQIVHDVCACRLRDNMAIAFGFYSPGAAGLKEEEPPAMAPSDPEWAQMTMPDIALVKSLIARSCFGGMKGDMLMMKGAASFWRSRFVRSEPKFGLEQLVERAKCYSTDSSSWMVWLTRINNSDAPVTVDWAATGPAQLADCLLDGVDFHCSSMIDTLLEDQDVVSLLKERLGTSEREQHEQMIKTLVWNYRSSINARMNVIKDSEPQLESKLQQAEEELFRLIQKKVDLFSYTILVRYFPRQRPPGAK